VLRGAQRFLWAVGFAVLGFCGMAWLNARLEQNRGNRELDRLLKKNYATVQPRYGGLVGKVEIPRLHLSDVVFEGTDDPILNIGVGHLQGSALPGQKGNVVLAGHRDSFFRALRNIHEGDEVEVTTRFGTRWYTVQSTQIVSPADIAVLEPTPAPTLTLVTCYPFYFVGHAPKRFIVRGTEIHTAPREILTADNAVEKPSASSPAPAPEREARIRNTPKAVPQIASKPKSLPEIAARTKSLGETASRTERHKGIRLRPRAWNDFS
jgi:sortase A